MLVLPISANHSAVAKKKDNQYLVKKVVKVYPTTYYAHRWSDYGYYQRVSRNGKRIGNFIACNFLPGGTIVMIPELFATSKFIVADKMANWSCRKSYKGKTYWGIDILLNEGEWTLDLDRPIDLLIVAKN